ncbi:hypothetical protein B0H10DRAFT_317513 [Mycena sp. CBHHK59/15]|nr:hypothetical protein B0H10DRAFT_317513 [Mycena sp. CBHHK59/15]
MSLTPTTTRTTSASTLAAPSSSSHTVRHRSSDVFRPRLPLDPFTTLDGPQSKPDDPWVVYDLESLTAAAAVSASVYLVLGAPTLAALSPLLLSPTLSHSLLILVTHAPPALASCPVCSAVRVLHLRAALSIADPAFALSLVHVLEAAESVARTWRTAPVPDVLQLAQDDAGQFTLPEPLASTPPLAVSEHAYRPSSLSPASSRPPSSLSLASLASTASASSRTKSKPPPRPAASTRAFDGLISFLPPGLAERAVLKQTVLATTLSAPFLAGPASQPPSRASSRTGTPGSSRATSPAPSMLRRQSQSLSHSPRALTFDPSAIMHPASISASLRPHVAHVLPPAAAASPKLTAALGAFLASYGAAYALADPRALEPLLVGALDASRAERGAWVARLAAVPRRNTHASGSSTMAVGPGRARRARHRARRTGRRTKINPHKKTTTCA